MKTVYLTILVQTLLSCSMVSNAFTPLKGMNGDEDDVDLPLLSQYLLPTEPDPIAVSDPASFVIPFRRAGNLILIEAVADTTHGSFILDTGAPHLVLNVTYFRDYTATRATASAGITGNVSAAAQTTVDEFSFGAVKYYKVKADMINLGHIEDSKGTKIFGLLGVNLFKRFEVIIDYEKSVIYLHLISRKEGNTYKSDMMKDTSTYHTFPIDLTENKIVTKAEIAGKKLNFIIDTGAESNVLDSRLSDKVFENVTISRRITLSGTGSTKVEALYGDLQNLTFGGTSVGTLPILITNLEQMCLAYNYCIDGMLGFDFLSLHKIGFNFVKREMYIWK